jgi:hypothetical protein
MWHHAAKYRPPKLPLKRGLKKKADPLVICEQDVDMANFNSKDLLSVEKKRECQFI